MAESTGSTPDPTQEDRRTAAGHYVVLSTAMMSVAMAIVGVGAALIVFLMDQRAPPCWFYVLSVLGMLCLVGSIVAGGVGVNRVAESGYRGDWSLVKGSSAFSTQCLLGAVGIGLFFIACLMSGSSNG